MHVIQEVDNIGVSYEFTLSIEPCWVLWRACTWTAVLPLILFWIVYGALSVEFDYFNCHVIGYDLPQLIFEVEFHHHLLLLTLMIPVCLNHLFEFTLRFFYRRFSWLCDQCHGSWLILGVSSNYWFLFYLGFFLIGFWFIPDRLNIISLLVAIGQSHQCLMILFLWQRRVIKHCLFDLSCEHFLYIGTQRKHISILVCRIEHWVIERVIIFVCGMIVFNALNLTFLVGDFQNLDFEGAMSLLEFLSIFTHFTTYELLREKVQI